MPISFFNYVHVFYNLILATLGILYGLSFIVSLLITISKSSRHVGSRYLISGVTFIAAAMVALSFIKFVSFSPFIWHFLSGSSGFNLPYFFQLVFEFFPKCFSPLALFALTTVLLRQTVKECENKGTFDEFRSFQFLSKFAFVFVMTCNVVLYVLALTSFVMDAVALYDVHGKEFMLENDKWFRRGYWVLFALKSTCVLWTFQIILLAIWIQIIIVRQKDTLGDLTASKRLSILTILTGIVALFSYGLAAYGYYDNHWLELVWLGDFFLWVNFVVIWFFIGPLNPIIDRERDRQNMDGLEGGGEEEELQAFSNSPIDIENKDQMEEEQVNISEDKILTNA